MTVVWVIARQQLLRTVRNRTLSLCSATLAALLLLGFVLEAVQYRHESQRQARLQARVEGEWRAQPDRHPHRAAHFGSFAFRPPGVLAFLDPGLQSHAGSAIFLEPHQRNLAGFSDASESSELVRFGRPSAALVLQLLAPLLLFCMTFASVAGEREGGTWPLCVAQGVSVRTLVLGKTLAALMALSTWLLPVAALGLAGALVAGILKPSGDTALRVLVMAAAYLLYFALCALLGVIVSTRHRRPQAALLSLLALWIGVWVVLPRLATAAAVAAHPAPSRAQLELEIARAVRELGDSHDPDHAHFAELKRDMLQKHRVARIEDLPFNYGGVVMAEAEQLSSELFDEFHSRLDAAHRAQDQLSLRWGLYTPLLALRAISMAAAGTDAAHLAEFQAQVESHRYGFIQRLNQLHTTRIRWENDRAQRVASSEWGQFEAFRPAPPKIDLALRYVLPAALALLAWTALAGLAVLASSSRGAAQ